MYVAPSNELWHAWGARDCPVTIVPVGGLVQGGPTCSGTGMHCNHGWVASKDQLNCYKYEHAKARRLALAMTRLPSAKG